MSADRVRRVIQRTAPPELRRLLLDLLDAGVRIRLTKSGVWVYGPDGSSTAGTHWTCSDKRALRNFTADLRRIGVVTKEDS